MYNFASDYLEGAHPQVMEALNKTNFIQTVGYGEDQYCQKAKDKIKAILENENVDIHFLVGGTQTNMIMISSALKDYQAVIAVDSGHINVHETGAVEFTGHKILTKPHQDGKMIPEMIDEIMREHPDEHMVQPKMVYISQTTEYGTYYTLEELKDIYECCQKNNLYLFIDGARLGSALVLKDAPTLQEMALYSDVFYIGGTKMGALFGEGHQLTNKKDLSQPGQFACVERVKVIGPKGELNMSVLGPTRKETQVEISLTDARSIGVQALIRESGDIEGTAGCKLVGPAGEVEIPCGVIAAKRHIHLTPEDAEKFGVKDKEIVKVEINTDGRSLIFGDVVCRVSASYATAMHIDTDESNAAACGREVYGKIVK